MEELTFSPIFSFAISVKIHTAMVEHRDIIISSNFVLQGRVSAQPEVTRPVALANGVLLQTGHFAVS